MAGDRRSAPVGRRLAPGRSAVPKPLLPVRDTSTYERYVRVDG